MKNSSISRRDFSLLAANVAAMSLLSPLAGRAQGQPAFNLGHFSSANPQTYQKVTGSLAKALAGKATVNFTTMASAPQFMAALAGGSLDSAAIGSSPMVSAFAQGLDISLVYIQKIITTAEALVVRNQSGIKTIPDLAGKKIGVPFNTSAHFALVGAIRKAKLKATDVQLINMKPDSLIATWTRSEIDGAYIWHPFLGQLAAQDGKIVTTTADLKDIGLSVFDGIVVRNEFKKRHPEVLLAYLKSYAATCDQFRNHEDAVVADFAKFLGLPADTTKAYVSTFVTLRPAEVLSADWMGAPGAKDSGVLKSLKSQAEFLVEAKQIERVPSNIESFVDSSFVARMV
ncbi:taurine ABC transporter substrate-binding protein [Variovorax boronicumulans]